MAAAKTQPIGTGDDADMFKTVSINRVSQSIIDQIKLLLREGRLKPGDRLPSERELCERFGVSRVTVREALRVLEASGLIDIRVGARGGAFVTSPTSQQIGEGLADLMNLSPMSAPQVTEARQIFELGIVSLVVERATDEDIAALRDMLELHQEALDRGEYSMALSADFHVRVAACTHNPTIEMLVQSFHGPLLMSLIEAQAVAPTMGRRGTAEHVEFVDAIAARDAERALSIMREHLQRTADRVREM
ncbi:FadR/GntR family transcriptional regulator [Dactylosporangium sp. AC04546]|uniref:FadR/GntR family transcriptional regulator n=1 Tax=Dactylosporangium sp. AC04546 TaxID=2862460 RepID=UPI001EDFCA50|nr:FadR/GntR family transcriptional regulator [Dactylosporangium sp. AC04546]WVK78870.1 FadR/GntR family transcriptional regulator [Dactylosporangium sp. AC04546]